MTNHYLYTDETGDFENLNPNKPLFIGGFFTSKTPEDLKSLYLQFLSNIDQDESTAEIHMTDIRSDSPEQIYLINRHSLTLLKL